MIRHAALPWVALLVFGAGWGLMQSSNGFAKGGGFRPFGIMVWQGLVTLILAGALAARKGPPEGRAQWLFCGQVAVLGTLIAHSCAVIASQTAYLVTGFSVLWSMLLLGERNSPWFWAALCLMLLGVALVGPTIRLSVKRPLAPPSA